MNLKNIIAGCLIAGTLSASIEAQENKTEIKKIDKEYNQTIKLLEPRLEKELDRKPDSVDSTMYKWASRERTFKSLYIRHGLNVYGTFFTLGELKDNYVLELEAGKEIRSVSTALRGPYVKILFPKYKEDADSNASTYFATIRGLSREQFHLMGAVFEYGIGVNVKGYLNKKYAQVLDSTYTEYNPISKKEQTHIGTPRLIDRPFSNGLYLSMGPSFYVRALPGKYDGDGIVSIMLGIDGVFALYRKNPSLEFSVSVMIAPFKWAK